MYSPLSPQAVKRWLYLIICSYWFLSSFFCVCFCVIFSFFLSVLSFTGQANGKDLCVCVWMCSCIIVMSVLLLFCVLCVHSCPSPHTCSNNVIGFLFYCPGCSNIITSPKWEIKMYWSSNICSITSSVFYIETNNVVMHFALKTFDTINSVNIYCTDELCS